MGDGLPKVRPEEVHVWDEEYGVCGGFLNKRAGKGSAFSKGKWQKRWFFIRLDLKGHENYCLEYSHTVDAKASRSFPLDGANAVISSGNSFQLTVNDGTDVVMSAESAKERDDWIFTLDRAISVANSRARVIRDRQQVLEAGGGALDESGEVVGEDDPSSPNGASHSSPTKGKRNPFNIHYRTNPQVRLDIDINSIPPSSTKRRQFEETFVSDICRAIQITPDMVEIISLKPALGFDWLTVVEFDIVVNHLPEDLLSDDLDEDGADHLRSEHRLDLLWNLNELVVDSTSQLHSGLVTCKLDPTFSVGMVDQDVLPVEIYSPDPVVLAVMNKYKDVEVPPGTIDTSFFRINVSFEERVVPLEVPSSLVFPRAKWCTVWPFEVMEALGFSGTMQELWILPKALVPLNMPKSLSQPIKFDTSARLGEAAADLALINASKLGPDITYDLVCDDYRIDARASLTDEELEKIQEMFDAYDTDGSGYISLQEMEVMVRNRVQERKEKIEQRFQDTIRNPHLSQEDAQQAEELKRQHLQHLSESQVKLIKMFHAADLNRDNTLSFDEFVLAEAWWMHCTLNPDSAHLF